MKQTLLFLTALLCATVSVFGQNPTTMWENNGDTQWYNTQDFEFTLSTPAELAGLSVLVAGGNDFSGKTIFIDADIDLGEHFWTPIGVDHTKPFSGTFNGNNNVISNLIIDLPAASFVGLFGRCIGGALLNINLKDPFVRGEDSVGALAGNVWNGVVVENCHATGVDVVASGDNIGGLVGDVYGPATVERCSSEGMVSGGSNVGGLLGSMFNNVTTTESFSSGGVYALHVAGGLIGATLIGPGASPSAIKDCYSRANVEVVNGVAGGFYGITMSISSLENCYSTGTVEGPEFIGGFIGRSSQISIVNNYWDTFSSNVTLAIGDWTSPAPNDADITGKSTVEMKSAALVAALNASDANGPWRIESSINDGYPSFTESSLSLTSFDNSDVSLTVYPNVFDSHLNIDADGQLINYVIYEISGKVIQEGGLKGKYATIETQRVNAGMYVLLVSTNKGVVSKRIIKQ